MSVLSDHVRFVVDGIWTSFLQFLRFLQVDGGVLEASAKLAKRSNEILSDVLADPHLLDSSAGPFFPAVHLFLEPSGEFKILGTADLMTSKPYCKGFSLFPQISSNRYELFDTVRQIATYAASQKILGYLTLEFIKWIDRNNDTANLWCNAIKPYFSESLVQLQIFTLVSNAKFEELSNNFFFELRVNRERPKMTGFDNAKWFKMEEIAPKRLEELQEKYVREIRVGFYSSRHMESAGIGYLQAETFAAMCTHANIKYDHHLHLGTWIPSLLGENSLSNHMLCISTSHEQSMESLFINLAVIIRRLLNRKNMTENKFMESALHLAFELIQLKKELDEDIGFDANTQLSPETFELLTPYEKMIGEIGIFLPTERLYMETFQFATKPLKDEGNDDESRLIKNTVTIELLNQGIPSSLLLIMFPDFGKEKFEYPVLPERLKDPTRISPGVLTATEYYRMMEKHALGDNSFDEFGNEIFDLEDIDEIDTPNESMNLGDSSLNGNVIQLLNLSGSQNVAKPEQKKRKGKRRLLISPDGITTEVILPFDEEIPHTTS